MRKILLAATILSLLLPAVGFAGSVSVRGYVRKNGTYVAPHYRSTPDSNPYNNWSYPGNVNPYTGKEATGNPDTYLQNYNKNPAVDDTNPTKSTDSNYSAGSGRKDAAADNLKTCLAGKYSALCNHSALTSDQAAAVHEAELAYNLKTCMAGKYAVLCNHSALTADQATTVREAELDYNLKTCMAGKYAVLCNHSVLTSDQAAAVREAELADNLKTCLTGKYPSLCNHSALTVDQAVEVRTAEQSR